ncbi:MAG: type VI secretion protein, partial [Alteraurantiacibacter sp.]
VRGWTVFGLSSSAAARAEERSQRAADRAAMPPPVQPALNGAVAAASASPAPGRDIRIAGAMPAPANDSGSVPGGDTSRETRIITQGATPSSPGQAESASPSRARGIGSRFKSAPIRSTEKF